MTGHLQVNRLNVGKQHHSKKSPPLIKLVFILVGTGFLPPIRSCAIITHTPILSKGTACTLLTKEGQVSFSMPPVRPHKIHLPEKAASHTCFQHCTLSYLCAQYFTKWMCCHHQHHQTLQLLPGV